MMVDKIKIIPRIEDCVAEILHHIGDDPKREGLLETPKRVVKSWLELYAGYEQDPMEFMKTFDGTACDEMILVRDIEFYSTCEHHMQPFFGHAHIAYIPDGRVLGVSKLARVLDVYARRLQIQEKLTIQTRDALMAGLKPKGVAVMLEAKHFCMVCRGVRKQNSTMVTTALDGVFKSDPATRAEFMSLVGK